MVDGQPRVLAWRPVVEVPHTTLWLPLGDDRPIKQVCAELAVDVLGQDAPMTQRRAMERFIHDGTLDARQRYCLRAGLFFWPSPTRFPPVANIDVVGFYPPSPDKPLTLEHYREVYGTPDKETIGPIETTEVELPAGPALRFHRHWARKRRFGTSPVREDILYAIRPSQIEDSVVFVVSWVEPQFSAGCIKIADKSAHTLRVQMRDEA